MLYRILLIFLVIDAFVLIAAILLQSGKGSGLAANFGGASSSPDAFIGIRQAGTILTKATWWGAGIFLGLAFVLQVMSTRAQAPRSVLEKTFSNTPAPALPAPGTTTNPAVPLQPIGGTPAAGGTATSPAATAPATGTAASPLTGAAPVPTTGTAGSAAAGTAPPAAGAPVKPPPAPPAKR